MGIVIDETANVYGMLTVLRRRGSIGRVAAWECLCECGKTTTTRGTCLRKGQTQSCGCRRYAGPMSRMNKVDRNVYTHYLSYIFKTYSLSEDELVELQEKQLGCCAICKSTLGYGLGGTHIDHDHSTGGVRGLLCSNCNRGLGYFKDSHDILMRAVSYLMTRRG